jgi:hypothetical protein
MTNSKHILAVLPLFAVLTMSPAHLEQKSIGRSIASEPVTEVRSLTPKYDLRAEKVDKTKLEKDEALDMTKFSAKADEFRTKLLKERKEYMIDLCEKEHVDAQKQRLEDLVVGLVAIEEDSKLVKEKGLLTPEGTEIHDNSISELKLTLETILQDEVEHDLIVAKERLRELEEKQKEQEKPVVAEEEPKKDEPVVVKEEEPKKTKEKDLICELEEKNKVLTQQVDDLMKEQKKIMDTMLGMNQMLVQMSQQMQQQQQQSYIPSWMMAGALVNPLLQYPSHFPQYLPQQTIVINNGQDHIFGQGQMGNQTMQQGAYSPQFQMPGMYQPQQDPRFYIPDNTPGNFGMSSPYQFNFGPTQFNQQPIRTA